MARLMTPDEVVEEADSGGSHFVEVPARLRPSAWREWLAEIPEVPTAADEIAYAYLGTAEPNPFAGSNAADVADDVPRRSPRRSLRETQNVRARGSTALPDDDAVIAAALAAARGLVPAPGWREMTADVRHRQAYLEWLRERGLAGDSGSLGAAAHGWRWSEMAAWERRNGVTA